MSAVTPCPACTRAAGEPHLQHDGVTLSRCGACGLVYMDPLPTPAAAAALYDDAYDGAQEGYFAKVEKKMRRARGRARWLARQVPPRADGGRRRLLDVGANGGFMVEAARAAGFDATGVELDPVSVAYARRHYPENRFVLGTAEALLAEDGETARYDAVYCAEVIEHVPAVDGFVAALAGLLRPGGVLFLTTPDIGHPRRPRDLTRWDAFCPPSHCLYFTRASLTRLLARHGLEVYRRRLAWKPGLKVLARRGR